MASLWGDYRHRISDDLTLGNTLGNNTPSATAPTYHMPSYTVVDVLVRADWRQWRLALNVSNLGDERIVQACQGTCYYAPERTADASLAYRW